jgi:hypothetical protein
MEGKFLAWGKEHEIRITPGPHAGVPPRLDQIFFLSIPSRTPSATRR